MMTDFFQTMLIFLVIAFISSGWFFTAATATELISHDKSKHRSIWWASILSGVSFLTIALLILTYGGQL